MNLNFRILYILGAIIVFSSCSNLREEPLHMFRGDLLHSGLFEGQPVTELPEIKWNVQLNAPLYGSPTIVGNRIYIGDGQGILYVLDENTGEEIWRFKAGGAIQCAPLVYRENVYFTCRDGNFYAVNTVTGEKAWTYRTDGEQVFRAPGIHGLEPKESLLADDWDFYLSSPAAHDERIFFGTGSGWIYALDAADGSEIWKFKTESVVHSSPAIAYGIVFIGDFQSNLYALDERSGDEIWTFKGGIDTVMYNQVGIQSSPVIHDSTIYVGCRDAHVYALDAFNGSLRWKVFNDNSWVITTPLIYQDQLMYATSDSRKFIVLDGRSGQVIYEIPVHGFIFSSPVRIGGYAYFGSFNGTLYAINLDAQQIAWNFRGLSAEKDPMGILNDDLSINFSKLSADGTKAGMEKAIKQLMTLGPILSTPTIDDGRIYMAASDGIFYSLE